MADGENGCAHCHILQGHLNWLIEVPNHGENTFWFSDCSCIGYFFCSPWKEKKVYTAHVAWEIGENLSCGVQRGVTVFLGIFAESREAGE